MLESMRAPLLGRLSMQLGTVVWKCCEVEDELGRSRAWMSCDCGAGLGRAGREASQ
jgi:hypothetical protein